MPPDVVMVAEALKEDVRRPFEDPIGPPYSPLRFMSKRTDMYTACPLGLHPYSTCDTGPSMIAGKGGDAFAEWWDDQEDGKAAVDAVWGP